VLATEIERIKPSQNTCALLSIVGVVKV